MKTKVQTYPNAFKAVLIIVTLFIGCFSFAANEVLLDKMILQSRATGSDSFVVISNGQTLFSEYANGPEHVQNVQSITKSVTGLAVALLLEEKKIESLNTPMSTWFPEWANDRLQSKVTLMMILNHTSGITDENAPEGFFKNADLIASARVFKPAHPPGTYFEYSNIATTLLQKVVADSSGQTAEAYVNQKIFLPMGIENMTWRKDQMSQEAIAGGMSLSPQALIKLGQMILNKGKFEGKQIVSESTVQLLLAKSSSLADYGLLWWLQKTQSQRNKASYDIYLAAGWGGQYIYVYPAKNLIVVRTRNPLKIDHEKYGEQDYHELRNLVALWK